MIKFIISLNLVFWCVILSSGACNLLSKEKGVIRYDVAFVGNASSFAVVHQQTKLLGENSGAQEKYHDSRDFGNLRYTIFDRSSGKKIYQRGLSPIFLEWLATDEAKTQSRSFYQGIFFPNTGNDAIVEIAQRLSDGKWKTIYNDIVSMTDLWLKSEKPASYPVDTILYSGNSNEKIDLVILSEGYTNSEIMKFRADARRMTDTLLASAPFSELKDRFNVIAVHVPSVESGADKPDEKIFCNTAFNSTWNTFGSTRYLTTSDMKSIYDAIDGVAWDHFLLLVNSTRYGGGGFYNFLTIGSSDNERSEFVFIHEFGHAFGGLADEYYASGDQPIYSPTVEPWEPNITTMADFDSKWKKMIDKTIPIPTPRDSINIGRVGLFEGGGYQEKGVYSPVMNCWMKAHTAGGFCPVCQEAIRQAILSQSKAGK